MINQKEIYVIQNELEKTKTDILNKVDKVIDKDLVSNVDINQITTNKNEIVELKKLQLKTYIVGKSFPSTYTDRTITEICGFRPIYAKLTAMVSNNSVPGSIGGSYVSGSNNYISHYCVYTTFTGSSVALNGYAAYIAKDASNKVTITCTFNDKSVDLQWKRTGTLATCTIYVLIELMGY